MGKNHQWFASVHGFHLNMGVEMFNVPYSFSQPFQPQLYMRLTSW